METRVLEIEDLEGRLAVACAERERLTRELVRLGKAPRPLLVRLARVPFVAAFAGVVLLAVVHWVVPARASRFVHGDPPADDSLAGRKMRCGVGDVESCERVREHQPGSIPALLADQIICERQPDPAGCFCARQQEVSGVP